MLSTSTSTSTYVPSGLSTSTSTSTEIRYSSTTSTSTKYSGPNPASSTHTHTLHWHLEIFTLNLVPMIGTLVQQPSFYTTQGWTISLSLATPPTQPRTQVSERTIIVTTLNHRWPQGQPWSGRVSLKWFFLYSVLLPLYRNSQSEILHMPWQHWYREF